MPSGCSIPYMSDMNRTMYGTAVVQALGRPVVMSSLLVSFARRPGGVRMMQQQHHQSMNRGMARANDVKHPALSNGMQAASVLQHHSLTNRGQTLLVQQRTIRTDLAGLAQQTVFQQQVVAPAAMTQSTMMHIDSVRQRALTAQQASLIQQRGIRYIPTGVLGAPLLQSQTIQSTSMIEERAAALMGHGLVRGVTQSHMMQNLVQQRYLGGPLVPCRRVQLVAGHPARMVNK
ncbi:unnamed protein product [Candidula unifasciata]|uniref:Uncharacterized protein n=1 Tax=Candidula unifasciata TaxID=100452 RepID=A0A8S4A610_9EUPU|nr:unnamed protein product [Candidula unifasciata]